MTFCQMTRGGSSMMRMVAGFGRALVETPDLACFSVHIAFSGMYAMQGCAISSYSAFTALQAAMYQYPELQPSTKESSNINGVSMPCWMCRCPRSCHGRRCADSGDTELPGGRSWQEPLPAGDIKSLAQHCSIALRPWYRETSK